MTSLKTLLERLHINTGLSDEKDLKWACELIIDVQSMTPAERDCIRASFVNGPLFDGDVPSKCARSDLVKRGYMEKVIVKGDDGYNACTYKGAWAYRLMELGA